MKKLVSFVALLLVTATMLSACGSGGGSSSGTVLKIGGIGPLSGDYANYGLSVVAAPSPQRRVVIRAPKSVAAPLPFSLLLPSSYWAYGISLTMSW